MKSGIGPQKNSASSPWVLLIQGFPTLFYGQFFFKKKNNVLMVLRWCKCLGVAHGGGPRGGAPDVCVPLGALWVGASLGPEGDVWYGVWPGWHSVIPIVCFFSALKVMKFFPRSVYPLVVDNCPRFGSPPFYQYISWGVILKQSCQMRCFPMTRQDGKIETIYFET